MKRTLSFLLSSLACCAMYSQSVEDETRVISSSNPLIERDTIKTFYGTEASTNPNNPCKGATIRVCAIIETKLRTISDGETVVAQQMKNAEGEFLSKNTYVVAKPLEEVKAEM